MDFKKLNQPVELSQIDFRVQSINKGGYATILAYKDARYDMNVLDKAVGPENWSKRYEVIDSRLYCSVGIYNPETGRDLYDFPLIQVKLDSSEFQDVGGRPKATWGLKLKEWTWGDKRDENGQLVQLAAKDQNGKVRFNWKKF